MGMRFTPYAWAKYIFLRDIGSTEVGAFGVSSIDDLGLITDLQMVKQECCSVSVDFDDESIADYFDRMTDAKRHPVEYARIWLHTHPGSNPNPSGVDEKTFRDKFDDCDWAVMGILAEGGKSFYRVKYNNGPYTEAEGQFSVDYSVPFKGTDHKKWKEEYDANVKEKKTEMLPRHNKWKNWNNGFGNTTLERRYGGTDGVLEVERNLLIPSRDDEYVLECYNCGGDFLGRINQSFCEDCRERFGDVSMSEIKPFGADDDADIWTPESDPDLAWNTELAEEWEEFLDCEN